MKTIPTLVIALVTTTLAFAQQQPPSPAATALAAANNAFACDLYAQLKNTEGNLFFSPFSVSSALAMTYAGAKGDTAAQMQKALHFPTPQENKNIHTSFAALLKHFDDVPHVQLNISNSLWPQKGAPLLENYLALVKQNYGVEITSVDFEHAEPEARAQINRWVKEKTRDKIQNIITSPLAPTARLVLVNAVYFKGTWENTFKPDSTKEEPFHSWSTKSDVKAPLMRQTSAFLYAEQNYAQFIELPYKGGNISMLIILPANKTRDDGIARMEKLLSLKQIERWRKNMKPTKVQVFLPKFRIDWGAQSLVEMLKKLGMQDAFDIGKADFSGMNGNKDFFVSDILQKAFVAVDEEGTEAAAATGETIMLGAMPRKPPPPPPIFRADHPFLFLIQDNATGCILFMGRVVNPAAQ